MLVQAQLLLKLIEHHLQICYLVQNSNIIKKRVEPGELEFFLHAMGLPTAEEFTRSAKVSIQEIKDRGKMLK